MSRQHFPAIFQPPGDVYLLNIELESFEYVLQITQLEATTTTTTIYFGIPIYIHGITYTSSTNQVLHVSKNNITDY